MKRVSGKAKIWAPVVEYWLVAPHWVIEVYPLQQGAYLLRGRWGAKEAASSGLLAGLEVGVDEICSV
jgi:hypothetical protein